MVTLFSFGSVITVVGNRLAALDLGDEAPHDQRDVGKFRDSLGRRSTEKLPNGMDLGAAKLYSGAQRGARSESVPKPYIITKLTRNLI